MNNPYMDDKHMDNHLPTDKDISTIAIAISEMSDISSLEDDISSREYSGEDYFEYDIEV